jgi:hypothetical protein
MTPDDTSTFTDSRILDILDEEMSAQVLNKLITLHGENLTVSEDIERNEDGTYTFPYRAVGNKLRDVSLINGNVVYELSQVSIGELPDYSYERDAISTMDKFYVENNKIKIIQPSRSYSAIRIRYYLRPSYLTKTEESGTISSIITDTVAGTVTLTLSSVGKNFTSSSKFDLVGHQSPNKIKAFDLDAVSLTTGTTGNIVLNLSDIADTIDDLQVGDYVALAEETPVPNIPTEMHPLLAQAAAVQLLESMTDTEALKNAQARFEKMTAAIQELIDDRVDLAPKKIKPRHGTLSASIGTGRNNKGSY